MSLQNKRGFAQQVRRECVWLRYSNIVYLLGAAALLLALFYGSHIVTSWNSTVKLWNTAIGDQSITLDQVLEAFGTSSQDQQTQNTAAISDQLQYYTLMLLKAQASIHYHTAILGGFSVLAFTAMPLIGFWLGVRMAGREYQSGEFLTKHDTVSTTAKWGAKICSACGILFIVSLLIAAVLPTSVELFRALLAVTINEVALPEVFEKITSFNASASVLGSVSAFAISVLVAWVFAMIGMLVSEIFKGNAIILAVFVGLYYLVPLGAFWDPRNILSSAGTSIFWFGGSFNPYALTEALIHPLIALAILVVVALLSAVISGYIRSRRIHSLLFMRKHE